MGVALAASLGAAMMVHVSPGHATSEQVGSAEVTGPSNATADDRYQIVPTSDAVDAEIDALFLELSEASSDADAAEIEKRLEALIADEAAQIKAALAKAWVFDPDRADELLRRVDEFLAT